METTSSVLIPIARLIKRHTFKQNKWKAYSYSGVASPWYAKAKHVYLNGALVPLRIEVPHLNTAEFFVCFNEDYVPAEKAELSIERSEFPPLEGSDFYLCDLIGAEIQSTLGPFKVDSYYENGDPSKGVTSLNLKVFFFVFARRKND
ncbi:MAG: hypothetical protein R3A80_12300 [Bdellovibrionota bacterium]